MYENCIEELCTTSGDTVTLLGATTSRIPFLKKYVNEDTFDYFIEDVDGIKKVAGLGTYNTDGTITRADSWTWDGSDIDPAPAGNLVLTGGEHVIRVAPIASSIEAFGGGGGSYAELIAQNTLLVDNASLELNLGEDITAIVARYETLKLFISATGPSLINPMYFELGDSFGTYRSDAVNIRYDIYSQNTSPPTVYAVGTGSGNQPDINSENNNAESYEIYLELIGNREFPGLFHMWGIMRKGVAQSEMRMRVRDLILHSIRLRTDANTLKIGSTIKLVGYNKL